MNLTKLQVRRGDRADLPQLSSAELGWAIDTQQLFIGNGSLSEGAPFVGNTEILTEYSNVLQNFGSYTFQGNSVSGIIPNGVERPIQDRLDDYVSVRAFGADGDGTNSTAAINLALASLYKETSSDLQKRIGLYFPAGEYVVSTPILVPPNAYLFGDGMGNTVIKSATSEPIIKTVDSLGQSGLNMGLSLTIGSDILKSDSLPNNILIRDLTFQKTVVSNLTEIQNTTQLLLERVEFIGRYAWSDVPAGIASSARSGQVGLSFISTSDATTSGKIFLTGCKFRHLGSGIKQTNLINGLSLNQCLFDSCFQGIVLNNGYTSTGSIASTTLTITAMSSGRIYIGSTVSGSGVTAGTVITGALSVNEDGTGTYQVNIPQTVGSTALSGYTNGLKPVSIHNSQFHRISREAVTAENTASFISVNNHYINVGNRGSSSAIDPVLVGNGPGCVSWMDMFERSPTEAIERFTNNTTGAETRSFMDPSDRFNWGLKETLRTYRYTLAYQGAAPTYTGSLMELNFSPDSVTTSGDNLNSDTSFQELRYVIKRDNNVRTGMLRITASIASGVNLYDKQEFVGANNTNVVFSLLQDPVTKIVTLRYTINPGSDARLIISATRLVDK